MQQLASELKIGDRQNVEDKKFYNKVRGREVQWQRKLQLMAKEGEGVVGAIESSQDLTGKVSKTCRYVKRELGRDGFKGNKYDPIMSHRRNDVQCDE